MADEKKESGESAFSHKDMLQQDLKTVDMMTRWRKKIAKGENINVKIVDKGMTPIIKIGDTVEVTQVHAMDLRPGNLILYRQGENFIARRIARLQFGKQTEYIVKGDAFENEEPPVQASQIIGKVVALDRDGERIELEKKFSLGALSKIKIGGASGTGNMDLSKGKDILNSVLTHILAFFATLSQMITSLTDKIIEKISRR
jgi:hypothetical protein